MTYTNNIPQGNQQIAQTQPLIQANFGFLKSSIEQEHNFNTTNAAQTYHKQASMPNQALLAALPAGTNGVYYVSSGLPYFYDGSKNYQLNSFQKVLSGTYTPTSSSTYNNIVLLPANVQGIIILMNKTFGSTGLGQMGTFLTDATDTYGFSTRMKINGSADDYPIELKNYQAASLNLTGRSFNSSYNNIPYTYKVFYTPV